MGAKWAKGAPGPPPASRMGVILRDRLTFPASGRKRAKFRIFFFEDFAKYREIFKFVGFCSWRPRREMSL